MTPVDQKRFEDGAGDCLPACLATMLGVPLFAVPHFCIEQDTAAWYPALAAWLSGRGVAPLSLSFEDAGAIAQHFDWARRYGQKIPWIAGGSTSRGRHFVVYLGPTLFHDPNPHYGRSGLDSVQDATFLLRAAG